MPDKKLSQYDEIDSVEGAYLIPIVHVSGNTYTNKIVSVQSFLSNFACNTHVEGEFSASNGALITGGLLESNTGAVLRGQSNVSHLYVANSHIDWANTFTPASSNVASSFPTGVSLFVDADYLYVSINGTSKRIALDSF